MKYTPEYITELKPNEIFVFGSNLAGIHGAGAARLANKAFGAEWKVGIGMTGQCYALPTKDHDLWTLPLNRISEYVSDFLDFAKENPDKTFLVTQVGCGLAGWTYEDIAPMFKVHSNNVILSKEFHEIINHL
jgi:hypothetical protein